MNRSLLTAISVTGIGLSLALGCGDSGAEGSDLGGAGADASASGGAGAGNGDLIVSGSGGRGLGDGGLGGNPDVNDCGGTDVEAAPVVANVLFVLDQSASMDSTAPGFAGTKWETLVDSLGLALTAVQSDITMGLELYPSSTKGADECAVETAVDVDVAPGTDAVAQIQSALNKTSPRGQTPTAAALATALDYFSRGVGKSLEGDAFVVLATDGGPNCGSDDRCQRPASCDPFTSPDAECVAAASRCTLNLENRCTGLSECPEGSVCESASLCLDDQATVSAVKALAGAGIQTIIVGMPGSESYQEVLDALAVAGGRPAQASSPRYHQVTDADGLSQTLKDITHGVIRSCEIETAEPPAQLSEVNVFLDGEVVPKDDQNGWRFKDSTAVTPIIELTGTVCQQVENQGVSSISVQYGCPTIVR